MKRLALVFCALCFTPTSFAQTGYPLYGSFQSGPVDAVNLQNLNTVVSIPVIHTAGRGGTPFKFSLNYNSLQWVPSGGSWQPSPDGGWITSPQNLLLGSVSASDFITQGTCGRCFDGECTGYVTQTSYNSYVYIDPFGTPHSFGTAIHVVATYNSCRDSTTITGTYSGYSTDSLYYMNVGTPGNYPGPPVVWSAKTGLKIDFGSYTLTDTNGNQISRVYVNQNEYDWKDAAGHVAMRQIQNGSNIEYHYSDTGGNDQKFVLKYQPYSVMTNFGCSGLLDYNSSGTLNNWSLPSELDLPNGQKYAFTYEATPSHPAYITGRLAGVSLPTGGSVTYIYGSTNDGVSCTSGNVVNLEREVSDGINSATWNYISNGGSWTTITTPQLADTSQANDTVVTFDGSGLELSRKIYPNSPGTGTPLRTINITRASNGSPATQVTILDDGTTQTEVDTTFDQYGLLDAVSQYDFGTGGHGPLIRTTSLTYNTSTNYANLNIRNLLISKQIKDNTGTVVYRQDTTYDGAALGSCPTGVAQHDDTDYPCSFAYRGNPTAVTTYLTPSGPSGPVTKNFTYDLFGNLLTAQLNCCQTKTWSYSGLTNYSEPDSVTSGTSPTQLTTSVTYYSTGQINTSTDENNLVTNFSYDTSLRLTRISQTNGGSASYSYNDTNFTATTTVSIDSSKSVQQITGVDGLGRPNLSTTEDASNNVYSKVSANYDLAGRAYQTSNPYTGSPSYWTTTQFDVLGRPISVTLPDNSATTYSYSANTATVADPTGKQRKSVMDAAGRLTSIYEPDPLNNNSLTLQTSDTYNALDELTQLTQGSQTRTYVYDGLGRLNSATTPEGGRVCYGTVSGGTCNSNGYDNFDNLLYRTDARGVLTSYGYDGLNRLYSISYNVSNAPGVPATASVGLTYGTSASQYDNGRLITLTDGVGSENYSYNSLGQMIQLQKVISGTTYTTAYAYNVANELTQITYPSGRVVQQSVDAIGRLCEIAPSTIGCGSAASPYATGYGYNAASLVTGLKYGNGVYGSFGFSSDRLQLSCLDYSTTNRNGGCTHDSTTKFGLTYSYGSAGSNNGQISRITDYVQSGRNATLTYDSLYRLTNAATAGSTSYPAWGLSETYDRYGNRSAQSISSGCSGITCPTNSVSVSATTNRITGSPFSYDAGGNMTNDALNTLTYDGEGRAVTASGGLGSGTYTYDGNGLRVKKVAGSTTTVYIFSGAKVIAEYENGAAPSSPTREYIYAGGALLAKVDSSGTNYYHQDHLSNRMVTNSSGGVAAEMGHFPFGESWYNATNDKRNFTTYEYDSESGNHYAMARYHVSRLGRLSSPDPLAGSTTDPQSLNRYSYSINDPGNLTDPSGAYAGCNTVQANPPKDKAQQAAGGGHADTDSSDADTDANDVDPPPQSGCVDHTNPFGGGEDSGDDWFDQFTGGGIDGSVADDSGLLPNGGFQVGQSFSGESAVLAGLGSPLQMLTEEVFNEYGILDNGKRYWMGGGISWVTSTGDLAYLGPTYSVPASSGQQSEWVARAEYFFSVKNTIQSVKWAWNKGYYKCLGKELVNPAAFAGHFGLKATEKSLQNGQVGRTMAGAYYHVTDARFTAWGSSSKVLVPAAAGKIAAFGEALNIIGWAATEIEGAIAEIHCTGVLK